MTQKGIPYLFKINDRRTRGPLILWNFGLNWPRCFEIADFRSIFARSAFPVTHSDKVQTLIGRQLSTFQWAQDEHRTLSLSPQRGTQKRKVSKIWTISYDNSETVRDKMSVRLLLITNRKLHTGFRLVSTSMTLRGFGCIFPQIWSPIVLPPKRPSLLGNTSFEP